MKIDCLCLGILFADCGCAPIARLPRSGELVRTDAIHLTVGGCAANAALDLAKLGIRVGLSGCVGDDPLGRFMIDALDSGGVDVSGVSHDHDTQTASTLIVNVQGEDRRFISTPGANTRFQVEDIPAMWIDEASVVYLGGYLIMPQLENLQLVELFRKIRARGGKTVVDVVLMGRDDYWPALELILPETDVFLPNDDEAKILTGSDDPLAQADRFRDAGARTVVITQGEAGSILVNDELRVRAGVYPTHYVSGTGSGDAFDAGFIAGMLAQEDPIGCLRWGSALGASCVRAVGATEGVFDRPGAEEFLREHSLRVEPL